MSAFLEWRGLSRRFGGLAVLNDVSLVLPQGGIFGLIGPNGAGKTTLFNLTTGLLAPSGGSIHFRGRDLKGLRPHEVCSLGIGRTFQNIRLFRDMTLVDNVTVGMHPRLGYGVLDSLRRSRRFRGAESRARERAAELLDWVGLHERRDELAGNLSYGAQRKLEIARALAGDPQLLLLDEPVAGMNTPEKIELMAGIRRIAARGYTVLLIEHDMQFVMGLCERIAVLNFGRVIAEGDGEHVRSHPDVIEAYLGSEEGQAPREETHE